jgi:hypothetical protein
MKEINSAISAYVTKGRGMNITCQNYFTSQRMLGLAI